MSQRGNIAIIAEVVIVIVLVFGFLVAVKTQSKPKVAATEYYPNTSSATDQVAPQPTTRNRLPESVSPTPQPKVPQDEIVYTDAGFSPDVLNVRNMNRVIIFRNKSSRAMKIVSDPHPSHTNLPSMNQAKSVEPGGVYWFAFAGGTGVFGYHNEVNPGHYGVIISR